jgi:hypothetical protein
VEVGLDLGMLEVEADLRFGHFGEVRCLLHDAHFCGECASLNVECGAEECQDCDLWGRRCRRIGCTDRLSVIGCDLSAKYMDGDPTNISFMPYALKASVKIED